MWDATKLAVELMETARNENPRGDLYRNGEYPVDRLLVLAEQNRQEVLLAIGTGEDFGPKVGDLLNYWAFIAHNLLHPPDKCNHKVEILHNPYGGNFRLRCELCGVEMKAVPA